MRFKTFGKRLAGGCLCAAAVGILTAAVGFVLESTVEAKTGLNDIIRKVEERYSGQGFSARFYQESTLKAMDITDTAGGKIYIRRPGMMRWEYEKPQRQLIVTNGERLWVYRPEDNQVMIGKAPSYFGDGKGAGFLADIKLLRRKFTITIDEVQDDCCYTLKLVPERKTIELNEVFLLVSKIDFSIKKVITLNAYSDETRIDLIETVFERTPDRSLFTFSIPKGTDVLTMD